MSFSSIAKEELDRLPLGKPCCMLHELGALVQTSGTLALRGGGMVRVTFRVESAALARRIFLLMKGRLGVTPAVHFVTSPRLGGRRKSILTLENNDAQTLLTALHMMEQGADGQPSLKRTVPRHAMTRQCCRRAFLRGAFLGAGSVTNPDKGYHLEIAAQNDEFARMLKKVLDKAELPAKTVDRKGVQVFYWKDSQQIADILQLMGAGQALMALENTRVRKNVRNQVNRVMNCDQSNMDKQLDAAQKQIHAIAALSIWKGLDALPPPLKEIAQLRLSQPEATLEQLGQMLSPPISKSGVNHRLRRLVAMAQELEPLAGATKA